MSITQEETLQSLRTIKVAEATEERCRVLVVAGDRPGRRATVVDHLIIGRSRSADLQIDDAQVSRQHTRIFRSGGRWFVEDLGSRNGTALNGRALGAPSRLRIGDRIQIGDSLLIFSHHDPLEDRVVARQKLEAVGSLGTGIAHDFNNLLGAVVASLDYLERLPPSAELQSPEVSAALTDVRAAVQRATGLTDQLLGFARTTNRPHGPVDLTQTVHEVLELVRRTLDRRIQLVENLTPELGTEGDRDRLHQAVMNLCLNARDAMPEGGRCEVTLRRATPAEVEALPICTHDDYAVLAISDTGVGMTRETQKRIFESFFTTKPEGSGAGLGLALTYETIDKLGGQIDVSSEIGVGTTMQLMLPLSTTQVKSEVRRPVRKRPISRRRILVVDDEDVMRRSTRRLLEQLGHEVVEAEDGEVALSHYLAGARPDVVLLDLNMPRMNGEETLQRLFALDPSARVVIVSGYVERPVEERLHRVGVAGIVEKPFNVSDLEQALADALGPARAEHPTAPELRAVETERETLDEDEDPASADDPERVH